MIQAIISCVKGEQWPATSFKSWVEALHNLITEDSIVFLCPARHKFTLKQALKEGIFTDEQAQKLLADAKKLKAENYGDDGRIVYKASDFTPNQKVIALRLACVRCGKEAQMVVSGPREKWSEFALCLECRADWHNEDTYAAFSLRTWGEPERLLWELVSKRFVSGLPPFDLASAKQVLEVCRWRVKSERKKRGRTQKL